MKVLKKTIAVFVSVSIFFTSSAWADSFFDDILMNATPAGVYRTGPRGDINIYTGGVFLRFGSAYDYPPPLFSITPLRFSAGCGGLSIKGMFMQLAGLDRLAEMLKNAGTSLAWGVVVGLVYSLPGVFKAFDFLNAWAKKIQQLLANACASGYAIGRSLAAAAGFNGPEDVLNALNGTKLGQAKDKFTNALDNFESTIKDWLEDKNFDTENMIFRGFGSYANKTTPTQRQAAWTNLIIQKFVSRSYSVDFLMTLIDHIQNSNERAKFIAGIFGENAIGDIEPFKLQKFALTGGKGYGNSTIPNGVRVISLDSILSIADSGVLKDGSLDFKSKVTRTAIVIALMRQIGSESIISSEDSLKRELEEIAKNAGVSTDPNQTRPPSKAKCQMSRVNFCGSIHAADGSPAPEGIDKFVNGFIQVLLYGKKSAVAKTFLSTNGDHLLNALSYGIVAFKPTDPNAGKDERTFVIFPLDKQITSGVEFLDSQIKEKGLVERSKDAINAMITGFVQGSNISSSTASVAQYEQKHNINWVVPGVHKFIKILQQSSEEDRTDLVDKLALFNAHAILKSILNSYSVMQSFNKTMFPALYFSNGTMDISKNKDAAAPTSDAIKASEIAGERTAEALDQVRKAYDKYFANQDKATVDFSSLMDELDRLDKKNKQRAIKAAPDNIVQ